MDEQQEFAEIQAATAKNTSTLGILARSKSLDNNSCRQTAVR